MDDQLLRGIAAARGGRRAEARAILLRVVERDERNEQAWLWLSGVMDDPEEVRTCLENVLELNPRNERARQGLEWLVARYGPPRATGDRPTTTDQRPPTLAGPRSATITERAAARAPQAATPAVPTSPPAAPHEAPRDQSSQRSIQNSANAENPCPYCGAPTAERQRSCTQCRRSLLVQTPPPERPSRWLGALAGTATAAGMTLLLCGVTFLAAALLAYQAARFGGPAGQEQVDAPFPLGMVTAAAVLLALGGGALSLARALRQRALPAYYALVGIVPLGLVLAGFALLRAPHAAMIAASPVDEATAGALNVALGGLLGLLALLLLAAGALAALAYRDFFGPLERFHAVVRKADPTTHYNNGVAYKNRGMWYMATREWEEAVARAPRDINYLRALGLAYAQIGRYEPAREMLDRALALAPNHAQLTEDRALVERLAAR
ncbi:MAG TPA: tetratricopeptide repeat protein [Roseiflexaceae bacterium]|nr:tetratricopeptide repeat protein [Roseiflexaceae bacterium]